MSDCSHSLHKNAKTSITFHSCSGGEDMGNIPDQLGCFGPCSSAHPSVMGNLFCAW